MTAKSMLLKRPVLRLTVTLFFFLFYQQKTFLFYQRISRQSIFSILPTVHKLTLCYAVCSD